MECHELSHVSAKHLSCIVKLPDEKWARYTKQVGDNKTILQLKKLAEVLLTGLSF